MVRSFFSWGFGAGGVERRRRSRPPTDETTTKATASEGCGQEQPPKLRQRRRDSSDTTAHDRGSTTRAEGGLADAGISVRITDEADRTVRRATTRVEAGAIFAEQRRAARGRPAVVVSQRAIQRAAGARHAPALEAVKACFTVTVQAVAARAPARAAPARVAHVARRFLGQRAAAGAVARTRRDRFERRRALGIAAGRTGERERTSAVPVARTRLAAGIGRSGAVVPRIRRGIDGLADTGGAIPTLLVLAQTRDANAVARTVAADALGAVTTPTFVLLGAFAAEPRKASEYRAALCNDQRGGRTPPAPSRSTRNRSRREGSTRPAR